MAQQSLTAVKPAAQNAARGGITKIGNVNAWPTERWVAVITLGSLALLIAIRSGFRGVNAFGVNASVR
jgi:hypothetical protein